jgi:hypothetical protein
MDGIPEAMDAANKLGIRLIPGVEISAIMGAWYVCICIHSFLHYTFANARFEHS